MNTNEVIWHGEDAGVVPGIFRQGADPSDEGARIRLSGYCKCQKSPTK